MSKLKRTEHWLTHEFDSFLREARKKPFRWGDNDCCLFAADAVLAITGTDIADDFRGKYNDEPSAFALIHSVTGASSVMDAIEHCATKHALPEWTDAKGNPRPMMARRGDLVAAENMDGGILAGVIDQSGKRIACMGERGAVRLPLSRVRRAWKV